MRALIFALGLFLGLYLGALPAGAESPSVWIAYPSFTTFPTSSSGQSIGVASPQVQGTPGTTLGAAPSGTPVPSPSPTPTRKRPVAKVKPSPRITKAGHYLLTGTATWYAYHRGQAAAGYRLRNALGPHWRGMTVTVCASRCVRVVLTDYMGSTNHEKVIDLDAGDFAALAPLGQGIVKVRIDR